MSEIRAIIFDLGRVLVDVTFNPENLSFFGIKVSGNDMEQILASAFEDPLFRDYNTGRISTTEFFRAYCKNLRIHADFETFKQKWCSVFASIPEMEDLFWQVKKRFPVGLLSDTDPLHWHYCLQHFPFLQSVENPTLSFEIGALKPEKICYLKAAENVGFAPHECLFIDDRPENVQGAKNAGMSAILFKGSENLKKKFRQLGVLP